MFSFWSKLYHFYIIYYVNMYIWTINENKTCKKCDWNSNGLGILDPRNHFLKQFWGRFRKSVVQLFESILPIIMKWHWYNYCENVRCLILESNGDSDCPNSLDQLVLFFFYFFSFFSLGVIWNMTVIIPNTLKRI